MSASGKITSLEVAKRAGVSRSAVSRVYTPGTSVSEKTAKKVRTAAIELGYRPNVLARAVITGKSRIIGLVVAYLDNQFYPVAIEKISNTLQKMGYHVLIFTAAQSAENVDDIVGEFMDFQVDGIILASVSMSSQLAERCQELGIPIVLFNRSQDDTELSAVTSDNLSGGRRLAKFLIAGGHSRIAYIAGWEGASTQRDREFGFKFALEASGHSLYAREVGNFTAEGARNAALNLFSDARKPDAVFVANDHMAIAVMDTLRFELGIKVPEDVSIVSYDDVAAAGWLSYNLTTIRQSANRMVAETARIIVDQIENETTTPHRIAIDGALIVRGSARIPKGHKQ